MALAARPRVFLSVLFALSVFGSPSAAEATTLVIPPLEAQAESADAALHGVVAEVESVWEGGRIMTYTTLRDAVDLGAPGDIPREVRIATPGGRVGDLIQRVHGVEAYRPGDEVVVFARHLQDETFRALALTTSVFYVERIDGEAIGVRRVVGSLVVNPEANYSVLPPALDVRARLSLAALRDVAIRGATRRDLLSTQVAQ